MAEIKTEKMATRQAYGKTLVELGATTPHLVVMDADLSKSTMTAESSPNMATAISGKTARVSRN